MVWDGNFSIQLVYLIMFYNSVPGGDVQLFKYLNCHLFWKDNRRDFIIKGSDYWKYLFHDFYLSFFMGWFYFGWYLRLLTLFIIIIIIYRVELYFWIKSVYLINWWNHPIKGLNLWIFGSFLYLFIYNVYSNGFMFSM